MDTLKIDIRGFSDGKIRELEQFIERWMQRERAASQAKQKRVGDDIVFATHDSRVNGPITRDEIYART